MKNSYFEQMQPGDLEQLADSLESSEELIQAIAEQVATLDELKAVWHDPSDYMKKTVWSRVWELTKECHVGIHWGEHRYYMIELNRGLCLIRATYYGAIAASIDNGVIEFIGATTLEGEPVTLDLPISDLHAALNKYGERFAK